jgi:hypothetical protein
MLMVLLGAFFPKTEAGTMVGNPPMAMAEAAVALAELAIKFLRDIAERFSFFIGLFFVLDWADILLPAYFRTGIPVFKPG